MRKIFRYILIIILLSIYSCGGDNMSKANKVNKLEVLAIKTDKPQAHPGDDITAKALIGEPLNYDDEYHSVWLLCIPEGNDFKSCFNSDSIDGIPVIDSNEFQFQVPSDILTDNIKRKRIYVLYTLCKSDFQTCSEEIQKENGMENKIFKFSYKTVEIISNDSKITNHNPEIEKIYLNNKEINEQITLPSRKNKNDTYKNIFKASVSKNSFDKYKNAKGKETSERITFIWKSTAGETKYYYTDQTDKDEFCDDNPFTAPYKTETENYKLYIIAIDNKGGIDWKVIDITSE